MKSGACRSRCTRSGRRLAQQTAQGKPPFASRQREGAVVDPWRVEESQPSENHQQREAGGLWSVDGEKNCCVGPPTLKHRELSGSQSGDVSPREE